jgi:hypothetical protein
MQGGGNNYFDEDCSSKIIVLPLTRITSYFAWKGIRVFFFFVSSKNILITLEIKKL